MVNSQVIAEIVDAYKLDRLQDNIPSPVPVIEVGNKLVKAVIPAFTIVTNGTSGTMLTTSATNDTYITGAMLHIIKDASATSTSIRLSATVGGVVKNILIIGGITLTAQNENSQISLSHPIKVDRNTNVVVTSTTNTGNFVASGVIYYYVDEVN